MRIKHAQHSRNGAVVDGLIYVNGIGVIALDDREDAREALHRILHVDEPAAVARTCGP